MRGSDNGRPTESETAPADLVTRRALPADDVQLIHGSRELLHVQVSPEAWEWWFRRGPAGPALQFVLEHSGGLVGHFSHVPVEVWVGKTRLTLGIGGYGWVARGFQGPGGYKRLLDAFFAADHGLDLQIGFTTARLARLYEHFGAARRIGSLQWWSGSEDVFAGRTERRFVFLRSAARVATWLASAGPTFAQVTSLELEACAAEVDALAADAASFATCIRIRDSGYLRWRWFSAPEGPERRISGVRDRRGLLRGWIVFGSTRTRNAE